MKFAFLLTQLEVGGAQVRVLQTADELRRRQHEADVFFLYQKRDVLRDEPKTILSEKGGILGVLGGGARFRRILLEGRYDALVTNTAPANILGNSIAASCGMNRRSAYQTQPPSRLNPIYRLLDLFCGSVGIYRMNIANSNWTRSCFDTYPAAYRSRIQIVADGISPRSAPYSRDEARQHLGLEPTEKIILNIGRLSKQKGQDTLLRALSEVPDATLLIAGDGELRADLANLAGELGVATRVQFLGELPGEQIARLLRAADVFAFPSRWETFGLAVVEAAASGLPLVASDLEVLREVLETEDGEQGASFVPVDDPSSLAASLNRVFEDRALRATLEQKSLKVAHRHSMPRHVDNLLAKLNALR